MKMQSPPRDGKKAEGRSARVYRVPPLLPTWVLIGGAAVAAAIGAYT
jgi:hypothetical protein